MKVNLSHPKDDEGFQGREPSMRKKTLESGTLVQLRSLDNMNAHMSKSKSDTESKNRIFWTVQIKLSNGRIRMENIKSKDSSKENLALLKKQEGER